MTARGYVFESELWLPTPRAEVFPFFADPSNLESLTPPWLKFRIETPEPISMQVGAKIDYRLKVRGIPLRWKSAITAHEPPRRFVDEQIEGPYRLWVHEHLFDEKDGGTLVTDRVQYDHFGGWLANRLFVRRDLRKIFAYRTEKLLERFGDESRRRAG